MVYSFIFQTAEQWIEVFYYLATVSIIGGILFAICGSGKIQPWASYNIVAEEEMEMGEDNFKKEQEIADTDFVTKTNNEVLETAKGETNVGKERDNG